MILVTGGAGFIGSNLVAALAERGDAVAVCDSFGTGEKWRNVAKHELADVVPPGELWEWLEWARDELEAVLHFGAISSTTERDVDRIVANNIKLSLDLW